MRQAGLQSLWALSCYILRNIKNLSWICAQRTKLSSWTLGPYFPLVSCVGQLHCYLLIHSQDIYKYRNCCSFVMSEHEMVPPLPFVLFYSYCIPDLLSFICISDFFFPLHIISPFRPSMTLDNLTELLIC